MRIAIGNGLNPSLEDLIEVAKNVKMDVKKAKQVALEIQDIVRDDLSKWYNLAF